MKRTFRILALTIALLAGVAWFGLGANRGWTRTFVPVKTVDSVTGIEGIENRKQFVPGIDLLGGALLAASALAGVSFIFRNQETNQTKQP
jgi:hypothetical protein